MGDARHIDGGVTTAAEARLAESGLIAPLGPGGLDVRTGVMAGPGSATLVTGTSTTGQMTVQIAPHVAVTSRGSANGVYLGPVLTAATTVNIAAAPGTGSRIDVVYVKQQDSTSGIPSPDVTTAPLYGVLQGTAGSSPSKPSLASIAGAEELATVKVAAGTTSTNGAGATITNTARQTAARGGILWARTQAERDAITAYPAVVLRLDTGNLEVHGTSGSWQTVAFGADTGWTTLPLNSPLTQGSLGSAYRVRNGMCTVVIDAAYSGTYASNFALNATAIPLPTRDFYVPGNFYGTVSAAMLHVTTGGLVINNVAATAGGITTTFSYPVG